MNRDKQIDEMARAMCFQRESCTAQSCTKVNCETTWLAENLYNAGYRKSTDLAREIFEEIEDCYVQMLEEADNTIEEAILDGNHIFVRASRYGKDVMLLTLDTLRKRLKKKYLESEKDDER